LGGIIFKEQIWVGLLAACLLSACTESPAPQATDTADAEFQAEIRWTSYGIPHVKANDWKGLGYGFAYATARDAVCVIARDLLMVNGATTRHFGPEDGNLESDVFHNAVLSEEKLTGYLAAQTEQSAQFTQGYVAGYNRYLSDHEGALPASCDGEAWVRPMTELDMARLNIGVGIRYGLGRMQREMAAAAPQWTKGSPKLPACRRTFHAPPAMARTRSVSAGR
jgi:acyl-homoserine-lactone acylase